MKRIRLHGKYAVGDHAFALVDDDWFDELNRFKWKAKPNAGHNHVYAVRVQKGLDGRWHDVRMHRVVLGYSGDLDIDHRNRNALDNRRANLRIATRSENQLNRGRWIVSVTCQRCAVTITKEAKVSRLKQLYCESCRPSLYVPRQKDERHCAWCSGLFATHHDAGRFCSESCRKREKYARQLRTNAQPPSFAFAAQRAKQWRQRRGGPIQTSPGG